MTPMTPLNRRMSLFWIVFVSFFSVVGSTNGVAETGEQTITNEQIIREFIGAWSRLDADELVTYFAEDGTYHNMPIAPVSGHANLREFIGNFLNSWERTDWEVLNIVSRGDLVIAERVDRTVVAGRKVDLPCVGVFEMEGGKIRVWRDCFDMATFTKGATGAQE
jgi:limonene-1,2-epoxide hydrolase